MSGTLVAHVDAFDASRDDVNAVPTPHGDRYYTPIPYSNYLDLIAENIERKRFRVTKERYAITKNGDKMFFVWDIQNGTGADDYALAIGGRSGHNRRTGIAMAAGTDVFCCDNWALSGEVKLWLPHRGHDLEGRIFQTIGRTLDRLYGFAGKLDRQINRWKGHELEDDEARAVVVKAAEEKVIPASKIMPVLKEYFDPRHEEFNNPTMWSLHNAVTEVMKTRSAANHFADTQKLTKLFTKLSPAELN